MKLRIQGDSIRFRLTQTEVSKCGEADACIGKVEFPDGNTLIYRLITGSALSSSFRDNVITITLPEAEVETWANSDQVGISGDLTLANERKLSILVEKDFKCLTERGEDERDMFPNPKESH
jgi:hypothetical protein